MKTNKEPEIKSEEYEITDMQEAALVEAKEKLTALCQEYQLPAVICIQRGNSESSFQTMATIQAIGPRTSRAMMGLLLFAKWVNSTEEADQDFVESVANAFVTRHAMHEGLCSREEGMKMMLSGLLGDI